MGLLESGILILAVLAIVVSVTGAPSYFVSLWQNYYIGKKYYLWVEVGFIMLIVLGLGLALIGAIIGGFSE